MKEEYPVPSVANVLAFTVILQTEKNRKVTRTMLTNEFVKLGYRKAGIKRTIDRALQGGIIKNSRKRGVTYA